MLKYLSCPNELYCGPKFITPPSDGTKIQIRLEEWGLNMGDTCGYIIKGPTNHTMDDTIHVEINSNRLVEVFVARQYNGSWLPYLDEYDVTDKGHTFHASDDADFEFNVIAYSNSLIKGHFVMTVWFESAEMTDAYDELGYIPDQHFVYIHENRED